MITIKFLLVISMLNQSERSQDNVDDNLYRIIIVWCFIEFIHSLKKRFQSSDILSNVHKTFKSNKRKSNIDHDVVLIKRESFAKTELDSLEPP